MIDLFGRLSCVPAVRDQAQGLVVDQLHLVDGALDGATHRGFALERRAVDVEQDLGIASTRSNARPR